MLPFDEAETSPTGEPQRNKTQDNQHKRPLAAVINHPTGNPQVPYIFPVARVDEVKMPVG